MQTKAMLALVIAGGVLGSPVPVMGEDKVKYNGSAIEEIESDSQTTPEERAYYLLHLADAYLQCSNRATAEARIKLTPIRRPSLSRGWEYSLVFWAHSQRYYSQTKDKKEFLSVADLTPDENSVPARAAMQTALNELDKSSDKFAKLHLYFIAAQLFQKMHNTSEMSRCNKVLEESIKSCEGSAPIDEAGMKAASSILNIQADSLVPVDILELGARVRAWDEPMKSPPPFTEQDFIASQKLKLRAIKMVDRLPSTSDVRRRAHRDLAFWYRQLGKAEFAEKQKQILFELVGIHNDKILYPQSIGCGNDVWWQLEPKRLAMLCGMG